jgi:adenylate cyclase
MLRMGASLVETYLGHDAGWRVLRGDIRRGSMDVIDAVLWYCDIRGFTAAADWMPRHELIATLNDYLDCLARPVEERGGQILKFLGDGFLATFDLGQFGESGVCSAAMAALMAARSGLRVLDDERRSAGKPALQVDIALHHGEVLYGNIGSRNRLDFTVVGPAVNEVSRMETLCESLNQNVLVSRRFRDVARLSGCDRFLVSVGSHVLRGVREPQELFTVIETAIDPTAVGLNAGRDSAR